MIDNVGFEFAVVTALTVPNIDDVADEIIDRKMELVFVVCVDDSRNDCRSITELSYVPHLGF